MQTHLGHGKLGLLNHFYTPGSFPDSRFIQLKSHSSSQLRSNTSKYIKRHSVAKTLTWFSKFSHSNNFLRRWQCDTSTHTHTLTTYATHYANHQCESAAPSHWKVHRHPPPWLPHFNGAEQLLSFHLAKFISEKVETTKIRQAQWESLVLTQHFCYLHQKNWQKKTLKSYRNLYPSVMIFRAFQNKSHLKILS